jgi:P27 family predicted phage terminase small subunit
MMPQGRPRKPTALKILHGDFKKDPQRRNELEPQAPEGRPKMPAGLTGPEQTRWKFMCAQLEAMHLQTPANLPILEAYVRAWGRWNRVDKLLGEAYVIEREMGPAVNPLWRIWKDTLVECERMLSQLGFTPAARSAMHVIKAEKPAGVMRRQRG